jgi:multidrug efflux pump subunit AcrA (membrane-fusion protein)
LKARLEEAVSEEPVAKAAVERAERLVEIGGLAEADLSQRRLTLERVQSEIRAARGSLEQIEEQIGQHLDPAKADNGSNIVSGLTMLSVIRSPMDGVVSENHAVRGAFISPSSELFEILDPSRIWVVGALPESSLGSVRRGQKVKILFPAYPDQIFEGRVSQLGEKVDPLTRTLEVRCPLEHSKIPLKIDMFATVGILVNETEVPIAVPESAIQRMDGETVIFVVRDPGRFEKRDVAIGRRGEGWTEVTNGLARGEKVVTEGSFLLKSALLRESLEADDD